MPRSHSLYELSRTIPKETNPSPESNPAQRGWPHPQRLNPCNSLDKAMSCNSLDKAMSCNSLNKAMSCDSLDKTCLETVKGYRRGHRS